MSYPNVLAGSTCTLTETADEATETATAVTVGVPQEVTISENGTATANVTNTYEYVPGALIVSKDIAGPAAGQQGQISIGVTCELDGAATALVPFVIPTGQRAGIVSPPTKASRPARRAPWLKLRTAPRPRSRWRLPAATRPLPSPPGT